ncbi:MAG: endonuclease/exonuclease/phosphatase family protein [Bacteroidia bacterium]
MRHFANLFMVLPLAALLACKLGTNTAQNTTTTTAEPESITAQTVKGKFTVGFYNVENLFDTEDDPKVDDADFTPNGKYRWTEEVYQNKLSNMAKVISQLGDENGPELLGLVEVENKKATGDLLKQELLKSHKYKLVQEESKDARGVDVAFAYDPAVFTYVSHKAYTPKFDKEDKKTRDFLLVEGKVNGTKLYVIVNHFPSRREGQEASEKFRVQVAEQVKAVCDDIQKKDKQANILLMGDFNDDPADKSMNISLDAKAEPSTDHFYNAMYQLHQSGKGSLEYKEKWNMFDQFIMSPNLANGSKGKLQYVKNSANVYVQDWMKVGKIGKPKRFIHNDKPTKDGYSDHFPVYLQLETK